MNNVVSIRLDAETIRKLSELAGKVARGNRSEIVRRLITRAQIEHVVVADVALDDGSGEANSDRG